jgi:hypothetical protein
VHPAPDEAQRNYGFVVDGASGSANAPSARWPGSKSDGVAGNDRLTDPCVHGDRVADSPLLYS